MSRVTTPDVSFKPKDWRISVPDIAHLGRLVSLQTHAETQHTSRLVPVLAACIPAQYAAKVLAFAEHTIPQQSRIELPHLRRIIKSERISPDIEQSFGAVKQEKSRRAQGDELHHTTNKYVVPQRLYILICCTEFLNVDDLRHLLETSDLWHDDGFPIAIVSVPSIAPLSEDQANEWSHKYWPTRYIQHNLLGPQGNLWMKNEGLIRKEVPDFHRLAQMTAEASAQSSYGESYGAVIVARRNNGQAFVIAVAGDARHAESSTSNNPMAHAVMRAIAMVARKRLYGSGGSIVVPQHSAAFFEAPLTAIEREYYDRCPIPYDGYLCSDLELYITHEPCVMCSMAMLHSRFDRVIFSLPMVNTGGLVAERGRKAITKYSLFWSQSMNWKFLAWQWEVPHDDLAESVDMNSHV